VAAPLTFQYKFTDLEISSTRIEKLIGFDPGTAPEPIPELIDTALNNAAELTEIRGTYVTHIHNMPTTRTKQSISINSHSFNTGKIVTSYIRESEQFLFFIVTAGKGIEMEAQKFLHGTEPLLGYIYDVIGSVTVESALEKFLARMEEDFMKAELRTTNPYSPGYCGWPVSDQRKLFDLFGNKNCGITLSETCLMDPIKSVSGIIGIGKNVTKQPYSCTICDAKNCLYRDKK
jgi:Vitamin B12 dependent methionine synthase, activation domain